VDTLKDEALKNSLTGLKVNDTFDFVPMEATGNETEAAALLGVKKEELEGITSAFRFTIEEISRTEAAELNEEFFEEVFPGLGIETEEDYWAKLRKDAESSYTGDSDHLFMHHVQDALLEAIQFELPAEFLKRWLVESNEGKLTAEDVENDFDKYKKAMRWQLIENRIIRENSISVDDQEIKDQVKDYYFPGWKELGQNADIAERLEGMANNFLQNNTDQARRIMDAMYERKVVELVKSKVTLDVREISYDDFITLDAEKH
jgi:trigger factor